MTTSTLRSFVSYLNSSSDLKGGTIVEYARKMMGLARDKHGEKLDFESFLTIVDNGDKSDENRNWFKGALHQVMVEKFDNAVANGETSSAQASPFYVSTRGKIVAALRLGGAPGTLHLGWCGSLRLRRPQPPHHGTRGPAVPQAGRSSRPEPCHPDANAPPYGQVGQ